MFTALVAGASLWAIEELLLLVTGCDGATPEFVFEVLSVLPSLLDLEQPESTSSATRRTDKTETLMIRLQFK
ncbi:MAG TPA: hypothetical protein VF507_03250 [Pyrinomonadaceae bacterium]